MWTFIETENVEPTNNIAEGAIRPAVILRRTSLGTQSERGSRCVERMLSVSVTVKQTARNLYAFSGEGTTALLPGDHLPKLLG